MSQTKEKILEIARDLFFSQGYRAISLEDLALEVGIKPASLYYHFPEGKEQIFITVVSQRFESYHQKIESLVVEKKDLRSFLIEFGNWYCRQKQMNMLFLSEMDMPHLTPKAQKLLMESGANNVFFPLNKAFKSFSDKVNKQYDVMTVLSHYLTLIGSLTSSEKYSSEPIEKKVNDVVEILLNGFLS